MRACTVVEGDPWWEPVTHEPPIDRSAQLLAVVMGARTSRQEAESVTQPVELRTERIRHTGLEPADQSRTPAAQHDAGLPGLFEYSIEAVNPPDGKHVGRVAPSDQDHVVRQRQRSQIGRRPGIEREMGHVRVELRVLERWTRSMVDENLAASSEAEDDVE